MLSKNLIEKIRQRIAPTREERLALHAERSKKFNEQAQKDFESMRLTPEILNKRCTL